MSIPGEIGSLIHLTLACILAIFYAKYRAVVILPALMLSSLATSIVGLEIHPFISGISGFAAALIVFIAGLELNPHFIRENKERVLIMFLVEAVLFLSLFYTLTIFFPLTLAVTIAAIMVASNEAFVLELGRIGDKRLAQYGITLSVLEDALAVFLLSVGFFTSLSFSLGKEKISFLVSVTLFLIPILYILSEPFDRFIDTIERIDARILISILYLAILIALAEVLEIPEAIPVFIGAIALSLREFNEEAFKAIESYFVLALMGFVSSLPFTLAHSGEVLTLELLPKVVLEGIFLAFMAFILRSVIVFLASLMGGLKVEHSFMLSLSLANTGEFGLVVLASLIGKGGLIPADLAYAAMFAYAFNLTFVSYIVNNLNRIIDKLMKKMSRSIIYSLEKISSGANKFVMVTKADIRFKKDLLGLSTTLIASYSALALQRSIHLPMLNYILSIFILASFLVAMQKVFESFSEDIRQVVSYRSTFMLMFRFLILYIVIAPLISFLTWELTVYEPILPLESPITLLLILITTYILTLLIEKISTILMQSEEKIV